MSMCSSFVQSFPCSYYHRIARGSVMLRKLAKFVISLVIGCCVMTFRLLDADGVLNEHTTKTKILQI